VSRQRRDGDVREPAKISAALLTGTVGSGKTAVAAEMGLQLEESGLPVAVIDLDWLGWVHLGSVPPDALALQNLLAVWPNFVAAGMRYAILVRALTASEPLAALRAALPGAPLTVVRLTAALETIERRLRGRDSGAVLEEHLRLAGSMAAAMDAAPLEDIRVANDGAPLRAVAAEVLDRLGWRRRLGAVGG
jgi:hypothetical protein